MDFSIFYEKLYHTRKKKLLGTAQISEIPIIFALLKKYLDIPTNVSARTSNPLAGAGKYLFMFIIT